jgi:flagellar assembly protein FliH
LASNTLSKVVSAQPQPENRTPRVPAPAVRDDVREFEPRKVQVGRRTTTTAAAASPAGAPAPLLQVQPEAPEEAEIEALQRQAFQHGYEEGERAGVDRASAQYREAVAAFGRSALEVATLKPRLRAETERELVELAFSIARRILRREISVDSSAVVGLIRGCLDQYDRADIRKLQVNPQDFAAVSGFFEHHPVPQLEIVSDPKISRGGAVFDTARGVLDARFEVQLDEIEKGLTDR